MRLLDTETGQFVDKDPEDRETVYAILSHTWDGDGEQSYEQLKKIQKRYQPEPQNPQRYSNGETDGTAPPKCVRAPATALGRLTGSEVEALLRLVAETFCLPMPVHVPYPPNARISTFLRPLIWEDPDISPKIRDACRIAREKGYLYIWIDSCCIDKSSSSELSEAINSMYKWYGLAQVCYAYLADVPPGEDHHAEGSAFRKSRWFSRGWTLQELIAPLSVEFLSQDWTPIGSKHALIDLVESITKVDEKALLHAEQLAAFSVAQRLSWAADRKTTRVEDRAYSLLGIFDINMPTLYGEGNHALRRLQEQIMQRIPDHSLFAWGDVCLSSQLRFQNRDIPGTGPGHLRLDVKGHDGSRHFFAASPSRFRDRKLLGASPRHTTSTHSPSSHLHEIVYTPTPHGLRTQFQMIPLTPDLFIDILTPLAGSKNTIQPQLDLTGWEKRDHSWYLAILNGCEHLEYPGHLLGRVCYIPLSYSGLEYVYAGYINIGSPGRGLLCWPDLFPLSPQTIERYGAHTKLKTVYISHPNYTTLPGSSSLQRQPYTTIQLVLLRETRDTLRSRGYSADLSIRDPDHPTTHWLTLSKDAHTITVKFEHALENRGKRFAIHAELEMSGRPGSYAQLDSAWDSESSDHAGCRTVSWQNTTPWYTKFRNRRVQLRATATGTLTVDLGLEFAGGGYYFLRVDVLSEESPAFSGVEVAGYDAGGGGEE